MTLPKWAKAHLAVNKLRNKIWGPLTDQKREVQDSIEGALYQAWRMGYRAGVRQAKTTLKRSAR